MSRQRINQLSFLDGHIHLCIYRTVPSGKNLNNKKKIIILCQVFCLQLGKGGHKNMIQRLIDCRCEIVYDSYFLVPQP